MKEREVTDYYDKKHDQGKEMPLTWDYNKFFYEAAESPYYATLDKLWNHRHKFKMGVSVPFEVTAAWTTLEVLSRGAQKYEVDSWKTVPDATWRYANAAARHLLAKDTLDEEWGLPHKAHANCNLLFLDWLVWNG